MDEWKNFRNCVGGDKAEGRAFLALGVSVWGIVK